MSLGSSKPENSKVLTTVLFFVGLGLLLYGAKILVDGSSNLALAAGLSPLVVGLTVVSFGTSSPELAVSVQAAHSGLSDMAVSNIIGSNIFNVLFVLGLTALIAPLIVKKQLVRFDVPIMIGLSFLFYFFAIDGKISRWEGILLILLLTAYILVLIRMGRKDAALEKAAGIEPEQPSLSTPASIVKIVSGLVLLVIGSNWMVDGAVMFARLLGLSEVVIGLTIVAAGTSLPEVAASGMAAIKGERDLAVGNVVGSNIFNILAVAGMSSTVSPAGLSVTTGLIHFDFPVMLAATVACLPIFFTGHLIARWEGALFFAYYFIYTSFLVMSAMQHEYLATYREVMVWYVLPLTAVTILVYTARHLWPRKSAMIG
jgi:cation:H+ antiporter